MTILTPLTGTETVFNFLSVLHFTDNSYTPHGDGNTISRMTSAMSARQFLHPSRGRKPCSLSTTRKSHSTILTPLTGTETAQHTNLAPCGTTIFTPLTGTETRYSSQRYLSAKDYLYTPHGDGNHAYSVFKINKPLTIFTPLTGTETTQLN